MASSLGAPPARTFPTTFWENTPVKARDADFQMFQRGSFAVLAVCLTAIGADRRAGLLGAGADARNRDQGVGIRIGRPGGGMGGRFRFESCAYEDAVRSVTDGPCNIRADFRFVAGGVAGRGVRPGEASGSGGPVGRVAV
jgi:hypothetical protein